ncbi:hypothetical protein [Streptomyces physcomitrii]|uniref:Uncharacterized protein n=1 Tax=Streptomyces physcomitrii TaxID=2724184 RepID=A0ABX1GV14_9ACTN|nr:hypothetical protein [Streptomyces physcomitrii]NKI39913.1 hypothetical protein [Streptomyces physcomitrii]
MAELECGAAEFGSGREAPGGTDEGEVPAAGEAGRALGAVPGAGAGVPGAPGAVSLLPRSEFEAPVAGPEGDLWTDAAADGAAGAAEGPGVPLEPPGAGAAGAVGPEVADIAEAASLAAPPREPDTEEGFSVTELPEGSCERCRTGGVPVCPDRGDGLPEVPVCSDAGRGGLVRCGAVPVELPDC